MNFWEYKSITNLKLKITKILMQIIDGKKLQKEILAEVKIGVAALPFQPLFCDVLVGEDPVSMQYVKMKMRMAEEVGIHPHPAFFPDTISTEDLIKEIQILNKIPNMCGIIVQLPLPLSIDKRTVLDAIDPLLDVDCLGTVAGEKFYSGLTAGVGGFPAALASVAVLDSIPLDLNNKNIVVLGQGELVGKPVAALLRFRGLQPSVINSKTPARNATHGVTDGENKEDLLKNADVIISGIGKGKYITGEMIKDGVVLIDAGTSEDGNAVVGDVDLDSVKDIASYVSPVPGGVGPVTVAMLLKNVLTVAQSKRPHPNPYLYKEEGENL